MAIPVFVCGIYESTVPHQFVGCLFDSTTVGPQLSKSPLSEPSFIRTVLYTIFKNQNTVLITIICLLKVGKKLLNYSKLLYTKTIYKSALYSNLLMRL